MEIIADMRAPHSYARRPSEPVRVERGGFGSLADNLSMYPNLKLEIFKRGLHQNHLARHVGMDETLLSKIIHGYREPTAVQRRSLAGYLAVEEEWLFERYDVATQSSGNGKHDGVPTSDTDGSA